MSHSTLQCAVHLARRRMEDVGNTLYQALNSPCQRSAVYPRPYPDLMHSVWRTYKNAPQS